MGLTFSKITTAFLVSTGVLLSFTASAKLYSATGGARILSASDPFFHVSNREMMIVLGFLELSVAAYIFRGRNTSAKLLMVLWLSSNFLLYRLGLHWIHFHACACLGTLTEELPVSPQTVNRTLGWLVSYWLAGSGWLLWHHFSASADARRISFLRV